MNKSRQSKQTSADNVLRIDQRQRSRVSIEPARYSHVFHNWTRHAEPVTKATIGILPGEGVGPELMDTCNTILDRISRASHYQFDIRLGGEIGVPVWKKTGEYLSDEVESFCRDIHAGNGALLCGPGGGRFVYDLRKRLNLFCKLTPIKPVKALQDIGPLHQDSLQGVDILMVRENMGGLYQGDHTEHDEKDGRRVRHYFEYNEAQVRRIIEVGLGLAEMRRSKLCVIYKPGGVPGISKLWVKTAEELCASANVELEMLEVDNASYQLIANAGNFDVVVSPNMFGDILADGASVLLGSRGMSYSANFSDDGVGVYQTAHGAAHDLAGTNKANPLGQIQTMIFMLREHFNLDSLAEALEIAIEKVLASGWRTADIMSADTRLAGTRLLGELIADVACEQLSKD